MDQTRVLMRELLRQADEIAVKAREQRNWGPTASRRFFLREEPEGLFLEYWGDDLREVKLSFSNYPRERQGLAKFAEELGSEYQAGNDDAIEIWYAQMTMARRVGEPWDFLGFPLPNGVWTSNAEQRGYLSPIYNIGSGKRDLDAQTWEAMGQHVWRDFCSPIIKNDLTHLASKRPVLKALVEVFTQLPIPLD